MTNLDSTFKSRDITLTRKICLVKAMVFSSGHVWMWKLDCEESWVLKNWSFWTVVLEKTLESPLDCKDIQPVHSKGDQPWVFFGRTDAKAETPVLWLPQAKSWLTGKDWCWEGLGAGGEGDERGWDGWMASWTWWAWAWVNSRSWWWTGRAGMLQFMGSQRVGHNWATELNWKAPDSICSVMAPNQPKNLGNLESLHFDLSLQVQTATLWLKPANRALALPAPILVPLLLLGP